MNRYAAPTLALAVLAMLFSVPAPAQSNVLQRCDKPMAEAEQMSQAISECVSALAAARAALAAVQGSTGGPEEKLVISSSPLSVDMTRAAMTEPLHGRLVAHYAYAAFAAGDPSQCSTLAAIGLAQENLCRRAVADLGFVRARFGSAPELIKACRRTDTENGQEGPASACCSLLAEKINQPEPCSALAPKCFDAPTCRAFFGSVAGSARDCRLLPMPSDGDCKGEECARLRAERVANCEGDALFAAAFKAKSVDSCGASERCRVLMGAGKAVAQEIAAKDLKNPIGGWFLKSGWKAPYVLERTRVPAKPLQPAAGAAGKSLNFKGFVCAEPMFSKENRQAMASAIGAARSCLADVEAATSQPSRALADEIDAREEKIIRLSLRLDKHFEAEL